ncbi:hypothetical protein [Methylotuvimicrobium alcaliphilum]|uniref:hypothetical protein n=1 Tax=Methylotuvimicrobium alcaliphilum TaxID=271065 RepID=UPI00139236D2|nr:hypothetical protein [Methylotuvimicrobium alcaliphilum]
MNNTSKTVGSNEVLAALRILRDSGQVRIRAATLAETLWPGRRDHNSNGQVFHLSAGIAGRMLRRCPAVIEIEPRIWEIIDERLESKEP